MEYLMSTLSTGDLIVTLPCSASIMVMVESFRCGFSATLNAGTVWFIYSFGVSDGLGVLCLPCATG